MELLILLFFGILDPFRFIPLPEGRRNAGENAR
jgi:hypothetical protein